MKTLFVFLLCPFILFSQTEKEAKLKVRDNLTSSVTTNSSERNSKIVQKDNSIYYKKQTFNNNSWHSPQTYYDFNRYRWVGWGAPTFGYVNYIPSYYYDRFGLRQPSRIYNMSNGDKLTVNGVKNHYRVGLTFNTDSQLGVWGSVGNKTFLITELSFYLDNDQSSFLPNLTMDEVIPWNDMRLNDIVNGGVFYIGAGFKTSKFGFYLMPGYGWGSHNFQFFDELFILSNNGKYSFPNYNENYFTGKLGALVDYKMGTFKLDYNPFRQNVSFGIGVIL